MLSASRLTSSDGAVSTKVVRCPGAPMVRSLTVSPARTMVAVVVVVGVGRDRSPGCEVLGLGLDLGLVLRTCLRPVLSTLRVSDVDLCVCMRARKALMSPLRR